MIWKVILFRKLSNIDWHWYTLFVLSWFFYWTKGLRIKRVVATCFCFCIKKFYCIWRKYIESSAKISPCGEIYALDPCGEIYALAPPCTLPSSVHCPVHLHTRPAPSVYTAFLLMPCQLRFEPATIVSVLMFLRIDLITNWEKFCTCSSISIYRVVQK